MIKILASDYDGTLRRGDCIPDSDRDAIRAFRAAGNKFGICTGRDEQIVDELRKNGLEADFFVAHTGSMLLDGDGNLLWSVDGDGDIVPEIYQLSKKRGCDYFDVVSHSMGRIFPDESGNIAVPADFSQFNIRFRPDSLAAEMTEKLNQRYGAKLSAYQNGWWVNAVAAGISKCSGLYEYLRRIGADPSAMTVAGDNYNDLAMFRDFRGRTVDTAVDAVKEASVGVHATFAQLVYAIMEEGVKK